eukprot:GFKZ01009247.1.p1 GENE.GFKZ01009247.1~~GFKZ01009247.1.p1  ORF type:complete len:479 (-),score=5.43 GFKZ01009247.1:101-1537(-)
MARAVRLTLVCFSALFAAQLWVSSRQPLPYMDELFHIPQAQAFCASLPRFDPPAYDRSITTPPLLYLPVAVLHTLSRGLIPCSAFFLRLQSAVSYCLNIPVYFGILSHLHSLLPSPKSPPLLYPLSLILFLHPVSLFYSHLYYTDSFSLFLVLLSFLLCLRHRPVLSSLVCFLASLTRQTSAVWHFFISFQTLLDNIPYPLSHDLLPNLLLLLRTKLWPHALAGVFYVLFLFVNNGIALGDRQNHTAMLHWAMCPYFFGFHALSYLPLQLAAPRLLLSQLKRLTRLRWIAISTLVALCFSTCIWKTGDYAHPFTLSDNRHYVFYIYRRWLLVSNWRRLALVPLYTWGAVSPMLDIEAQLELDRACSNSKQGRRKSEERQMEFVWRQGIADFGLCLCAVACVLPAGLLEPRYFGVGSMIWAVRRAARCGRGWDGGSAWVIVAVMVVVNVMLLYVFLEMPFDRAPDLHMPRDLSPGRFMF